MRTIIEYKDGRVKTVEDVGPMVYEGMLSLVDAECGSDGNEVPIDLLKRVVFEVD